MTSRSPAAALLLAVTGLVLAGCSISGGAAPSPTPTDDPGTPVLELAVGDCIAEQSAHVVSETVPVVDCSTAHESEAYALVSFDVEEFPGDTAVTDRAVAECTDRFSEFVGVAYEASSLDFAYYFPTRSSWERGDRDIVCLVIDPADPAVVGTLEGAAR